MFLSGLLYTNTADLLFSIHPHQLILQYIINICDNIDKGGQLNLGDVIWSLRGKCLVEVANTDTRCQCDLMLSR